MKQYRTPKISYWIYFTIISIIGVLGGVYIRLEYGSFKYDSQRELSTIADLKSSQITKWLNERLDDAELILKSPTIQEIASKYIQNPQKKDIDNKLKQWLKVRQEINNYAWIGLLDTTGKVIKGYPEERIILDPNHQIYINKVIKTKQIVFADLHLDYDNHDPTQSTVNLSYWIPVLDKNDPNNPVKGIWLLKINPWLYLFPLIQTWPVYSKTGETLIIRREGKYAVFLNELRHKKDTALKFKLELDKYPRTPAVIAVKGYEGALEGIDYRGVPVLAVTKKIKDTPWFLVTKIDKKEVYKPYYYKIVLIGLSILLLIILTAIAIVFIERNRQVVWLAKQLALEKEKSKLQEEYKAVAREWETTFSSINEMIWILDKDMKIARVNKPLNPALPLLSEDLIGNHCWKVVHGLDQPIPECPFLPMMQTKKRAVSELKLGDKWIEVSIDPILDDNEKIVGAVHIISDITMRKTVEERIQASEKLLQEIIDSAPFGAHTYQLTEDNKLILIKANESAEHILNLDHTPLIGKELLEAFPGNIGTELPIVYRLTASQGIRYDNEMVEYRYDKINGAFEVHAIQTGHNIVTVFFQDITKRKQAEEIIRRSQEELEQLVKQRTMELENANKELESFSYSVSHDLRAPLRGIDGWSQALMEDYGKQLDEKAQSYIKLIRSNTNRMGLLIDDLLKLAHVSKKDIVKTKVNLSYLALEIVGRLKEEDVSRKANFIIAPDVIVYGDKNLLETALYNLLNNAWKFSSKKKETIVEFGTQQQGEKTVYFVKDNGVGFDMQYVDKLFGPFQRLHSTAEYPGTGIGLATVQRIIHRHGGKIWVKAILNQGATFYFTLEE